MSQIDCTYPCSPCEKGQCDHCASDRLYFWDVFDEEVADRNCSCRLNDHGKNRV